MKAINLLVLSLFLVFSAVPAFSIDLGSAKQQKLVGETDRGYLAAVGGANGAVQNLVNGINAKRKAQYQKMAQQNNVGLKDIEKLAGQKSIAKTPAGQMVQVNGKWKQK